MGEEGIYRVTSVTWFSVSGGGEEKAGCRLVRAHRCS